MEELWQRRAEREKAARLQAETLLTQKTRELYEASEKVKASLQTATQLQRRLELALWASGETIWEWQASDDQFEWDEMLEQEQLKLVSRQLLFFELMERIHPEDRAQVITAWRAHLFGSSPFYQAEYRLQAGEEYRWWRVRGRAVERDAHGVALRVTGTLKNIDAERASESHMRMLAAAFRETRDAIVVLSTDGRIIQHNEALGLLTGASSEQLLGANITTLLSATDSAIVVDWWLQHDNIHSSAFRLQLSSGQSIPIEVTGNIINQPNDNISHVIMAMRDISERQRAANKLTEMATTDALTRLPNRHYLMEYLNSLEQSENEHLKLAILFLDLDGFKEINDAYGHAMGDQVLVQVAERLRSALRKEDVIARWGGDEFIVVLSGQAQADNAKVVAEKIVQSMSAPLILANTDVTVTSSVGIALSGDQNYPPHELLQQADAAMYLAKSQGRNQYAFYQPALKAETRHRVAIAQKLRWAIDNDELTLALQPKVEPKAGKVVGAEALLRWHSKEFGHISPAQFIPIAEENGLIKPLGSWVLRQALGVASECMRKNADVKIAINLSARQIHDPDLLAMLSELLMLSDVSPEHIELEITESSLLGDIGFAETLFQRLKSQGFSLALDDFGTGYSSLAYLRRLPIDRIKIDRSFLLDAERHSKGLAMLQAIAGICHALQLAITVEGVETAQHLTMTNALNADEIQGYYYYKPMPPQEFIRLVDNRPS